MTLLVTGRGSPPPASIPSSTPMTWAAPPAAQSPIDATMWPRSLSDRVTASPKRPRGSGWRLSRRSGCRPGWSAACGRGRAAAARTPVPASARLGRNRPGVRELRGDGRHLGVVARLPGGQGKALAGIGDRIFEQGAQRPRAKALGSHLPGVDDAWDTGRLPAVLRNASEGEVAIDGGVMRGAAAAVDCRHGAPLRRRHQQEQVTPQLAAPWLDHRQYRARRDRRTTAFPPSRNTPSPAALARGLTLAIMPCGARRASCAGQPPISGRSANPTPSRTEGRARGRP